MGAWVLGRMGERLIKDKPHDAVTRRHGGKICIEVSTYLRIEVTPETWNLEFGIWN